MFHHLPVNQSQKVFLFALPVNFNESGGSDVEAGIQFIYHMREHLVDIGIATIYGLTVYAIFLFITKKIKG